MKLLQPKLEFYKIGNRQDKMTVIFDTLVNSISEASLQESHRKELFNLLTLHGLF